MSGTKISSLLAKITILFVICCCNLSAHAKYGGGTGEPNDPYRIATAEHLNDIGNHIEDWGSHFVMVNDVNLAEYTGDAFNVIGTYYTPFVGDFNGNNHVIFNFTCTSAGLRSTGMFGSVSHGRIINVGLINANVNAASAYRVGSLVGHLLNSSVSNCFAVGGSVSGKYYVGGLIGDTWECKVSNCFTNVNVSGDKYVGGLIGENEYYYGLVSNCYTTGTVIGNERVGGLVGYNRYASIYNSFSTADVDGSVFVGGRGLNR